MEVVATSLCLPPSAQLELALNRCKICNGSIPGELSLVEYVRDVA
jgi:hypothetical protein